MHSGNVILFQTHCICCKIKNQTSYYRVLDNNKSLAINPWEVQVKVKPEFETDCLLGAFIQTKETKH